MLVIFCLKTGYSSNMKTETVSIIISTKNRACYLPRALDSVISQTFTDYILYVFDDASTDETKDLLESYRVKIPSMIILRNEVSQWTTANARKLVQLSRWRYIARLDDDDLWLPEKLEKQIEFLEKNSEVVLLGTAIRGIAYDGALLAPKINACTDDEIYSTLLQVNQFAQSSVIFRRKIYFQIWWYDNSFVTEDYELWLRMKANGGKLANLSEILTYIGVTEGQITQKKRRRLIRSEIRAVWKYRRVYPGWIRASIKRLGALMLSPKISRLIGGYLRKYTSF